MNNKVINGWAVVAAFALAGCGGGGGGGGSAPPPPPPPPATGWSVTSPPLSVGGSGSAKVAMDASGRALAVWLTVRPGTLIDDDLMVSRYIPGSGWSTPQTLESRLNDVTRFEIAMEPASGRAVVLWTQASDTSNSGAWARHFDPAGGWTPVQALSTASGVVDVLSVGMDVQGHAVAAWSQLDGSRFSIWGNRGSAAGTWGTAQLLENMDEAGRVDGNPRIAVAPQGDAVVVWQASGGILGMVLKTSAREQRVMDEVKKGLS